ncbi:single-stranded DNA-binding protein [Phreatobacter sp. HK31-P]
MSTGSMNKVLLIGRLGADPEIKRLNSGDRVCNMRIATSENWRDKQTGERREKSEWHNLVIMNDKLVGVCEQWLSKGDQILVDGKLQTRKWQDAKGEDKFSTEVMISGFGGGITIISARRFDENRDARAAGGAGAAPSSDGSRTSRSDGAASSPGAGKGASGGSPYDDDEIPFGPETR